MSRLGKRKKEESALKARVNLGCHNHIQTNRSRIFQIGSRSPHSGGLSPIRGLPQFGACPQFGGLSLIRRGLSPIRGHPQFGACVVQKKAGALKARSKDNRFCRDSINGLTCKCSVDMGRAFSGSHVWHLPRAARHKR
jgi:hypothetical protein